MLSGFLSGIIQWLVDTIGAMGYWGIAGLMFLESSFFHGGRLAAAAVIPVSAGRGAGTSSAWRR